MPCPAGTVIPPYGFPRWIGAALIMLQAVPRAPRGPCHTPAPSLHAQGREGLPPNALVFEASRKRTRPATEPLTPEQRQEKTKTDHRRLLRRVQEAEGASESAWHAPAYRSKGTTALDHHRALPVVATTLPLLRTQGAAVPIWRRFGCNGRHTLDHALANPNGDRLLRTELAAVEQAREKERAEAEREGRRPACTRCKETFTNERWAEQERADTWGDDGLCAGCRQGDADQRARREAEREQAEAAAAEAKGSRSHCRPHS